MEPEAKLAKILDECLARISEGKTVDVCVAGNPDMPELEHLLYTGLFVNTVPGVRPSEEFRRTAKGRLMARLHEETNRVKRVEVKAEWGISLLDGLTVATQGLWQAVAGVRKVAIPVAIGLLLIITTVLGASNFISPSSTLASGCTLSILSGTVEIQSPETDSIQQGTEGMTIDTGTRVKTEQDSRALLTFFDGSTLTIEPGTDIEIKQLEHDDEETITIVLKQWMGNTWSRVVKMADSGSHYEIQTPSAVALVRGTRFLTEVNEAGETRVHTTEGLVSVSAHGDEVFVPAGRQTTVESGTSPSEPIIASDPEDKEPQEQAQEEQANNSYLNTTVAQGQAQNDNKGQAQNDNKDLGQNEKEDRSQNDNKGLGQNDNKGNSQNEDKGLSQKENENKGNNQGDDQGQGNDNGQGNSQGQGNDQGKGNNKAQGNDNVQNQGVSDNITPVQATSLVIEPEPEPVDEPADDEDDDKEKDKDK